MESLPSDSLTLIIKVVNRLLTYRYPSGVPVGFYLALVHALQELQEAQSYMKYIRHD